MTISSIKQSLSSAAAKFDSMTDSKWYKTALLVAGLASVIGAIGFFGHGAFPNALTHVLGKTGCKTMLILGGSFVGTLGLKTLANAIKSQKGPEEHSANKFGREDQLWMPENNANLLKQLVCTAGTTSLLEVHLERPGTGYAERDEEGKVLLHHAVEQRNVQITRLLLDKSANPNPRDNNLQTPLHLACLKGDAEMISVLLEFGLSVNDRDINQKTPLHLAVESENIESVKILLTQQRIDFSFKDGNGQTALDIATTKEKHEIVALLEEKIR